MPKIISRYHRGSQIYIPDLLDMVILSVGPKTNDIAMFWPPFMESYSLLLKREMTLTLQIVEKKSNNIVGNVHINVGESFKLGRNPDLCDATDFRLRDRKISQQHVEIHNDGKQVRLVDLGSTNGTWLNGNDFRSSSVVIDNTQFANGKIQFGAGDNYSFFLVLEQKASRPETDNRPAPEDDEISTLIEPEDDVFSEAEPESNTLPKKELQNSSQDSTTQKPTPEATGEIHPEPVKQKLARENIQRDESAMDVKINFDPDDLNDDNW